MSPIPGRECGTKTRSKQTGSFDWAKGVENPPRQRPQSGVGSWPRAAASAAAAAAAAGIMNRHDPRCRARRQERGSKRIREKNPHLRARTYTRPTRRGDIPIGAFHLALCSVPSPVSTRSRQVQ